MFAFALIAVPLGIKVSRKETSANLGIGLALALMLPTAQRHIVVLFAAMPTASSAYVLAARMGGDSAYVAGLVTVSTLLGMLSIPIWLAVLQSLGS